jgi:hypothetical protein
MLYAIVLAAALLNFVPHRYQVGLWRRNVMRGWTELARRQLDDFGADTAMR